MKSTKNIFLKTFSFVFTFTFFLLFFSRSSFAFIMATEPTSIVYENKVHTIYPVFNLNIIDNSLILEAVKIDEEEIINLSVDFSSINLGTELEDIHYEIDDNKDIYIIGRKDDEIFFKNLSVPNSFVIVKNIKEIPSWIDNVYAKERLEEKKKETFQDKTPEEVILNNRLFLINYDGEQYTYLNTRNLKVTNSKFTKGTEKILEKAKEIKIIGKKDHPLLIEHNSSFLLLSKSQLNDWLYYSNSGNYEETEKTFERIIEEISSPTFEDATKVYFEESEKKDGKIGIELKERKIKEEEKEEYKKVIFKYKKSKIEKKKNTFYYSTTVDDIKYFIKIKKKDWEKIRKRKDLKGYCKKDITEEINKLIDEKVIEYCRNAVGAEYSQKKRTQTPDYYDCSSLVYYAYKEMGINLYNEEEKPPVAADEAKYLDELGNLTKCNNDEINEEEMLEKLKPGDLIFYSNHTNDRYMDITHVVMYIGEGKIIHASGVKKGVCEQEVYFKNIVGYGNPIEKGKEWDVFKKNITTK